MSKNLSEWYDNALSKEEYRQTLTKLKDDFDYIYDNFSVKFDDDLDKLKEKDLKILAIAEPWCAHSMLNIAILLRMAEAYEFEPRFVLRDKHMDLMAHYQTHNKDYIPIFIILDPDGNELNVWGPWAPKTKETVDEEKRYLPKTDSEEYNEKYKDVVKKLKDVFASDEDLWVSVYEDIKKTLLNA